MGLGKWIRYQYLTKLKKLTDAQMRIERFKQLGMKIGDGTDIYSDSIMSAEPYLVEIGSNCIISTGVMFATHDASAKYYIEGASDIFGRIKIGNNCFIGMGTIMLPGTEIGDNCIVGAGSVITKKFQSTSVVIAGNPARILCSVKDLERKNKKYGLNIWGKTREEKKRYLLENENKFKGFEN